jgi:uncharacterized repeat protein (TIGR04076 family)
MAQDPGIGYRVVATVTGVKGKCNAGHQVGDTFEISCHNPAGLCGFFYHDIFPSLSTLQWRSQPCASSASRTRNRVWLS